MKKMEVIWRLGVRHPTKKDIAIAKKFAQQDKNHFVRITKNWLYLGELAK